MRWPIDRLVVTDAPDRLAALRLAEDDLKGAGNIGSIEYVERTDDAPAAYEVSLAEDETAPTS